ncbi:LLM class flavin-dependent oxidoreductase [Galbitalea soli]|uniref:LLM class flavin-dependent oxidoreductase n=1 Tax=Galbitalea soli TaxID=1268042 RepID=A0A7C9PNX6_9MICO|nr:LLM class flavin-dependent oxidoreductase [Galbitalea soli]NEM91972.1 LLM class flavin-dependent oxidoreductase [Galbitalea soli]NYJ32078.1 FMN-dependent oxidoreductase (nitrilotriacetate monooxygenase family) [Galbitalea soli]
MTKPIAINAFSMNTISHLSPGTWRHPRDEGRRYVDLDYWMEVARTLERGKIDVLFLADVLGVYDVYGGSPAAAIRGGVQFPLNDPLALIPAMASVTEHLGFAMTAAVSYEHPFPFARRMSTLDHLTKGRVGWNVVTGYLNSGAVNFGVSGQEAHDRRYDIAEEYLEVCYKLWERSWEDDARSADAAGDVVADPARVHPIAHRGEFFQVPGIHLSEPSPQRTPVIYQAGASARGVRFAAAHGEGVFVAAQTKAALARQVRGLREALAAAGRPTDSAKVLNQQTVIVAETDAEAHRLFEEYLLYASTEGALTLLSGWTGIDFAELGMESTFEDQEGNAIQSVIQAFSSADPGRSWSIREIAEHVRIGGDGPVLVGSPTTVADQLESWVDETDVDGFNLAAAVVPEAWTQIVDLLVPELQKRGRHKVDYEPGTLREKLGGGARVAPWHPAARVRI